MDEMISYCGLVCTDCPAYAATRKGDEEALKAVAAEWTRDFGVEISPESVLCDGCRSDTGRVCEYSATCPVRTCGVERGHDTCAECPDYACERLRVCPAYRSRGRGLLEKLRSER